MKSLLIIAAGAIGIGVGIMIYKRRYTSKQNIVELKPVVIPKKHHLTTAFSNAKKHVVHKH